MQVGIFFRIQDLTLYPQSFVLSFVHLSNFQGLGKDGSGMVEPVQAQATESRAGLGSLPKKTPGLEVQAGDSYKTLIQKKAMARFRDMS